MSRTDQALEAARKVSSDDAEYFRAATGLLESLCRKFEAVAPTHMPVSRFKVGFSGQMEAAPHGNWVHRGDYEALEKLYIEATGCCVPPEERQIELKVLKEVSDELSVRGHGLAAARVEHMIHLLLLSAPSPLARRQEEKS